MDETKLRSALSVIASDPEPPTTIDVAAARRHGRRRQRVRHIVAPVAVALAVAAAVIVPATQFRAAPRPAPVTPVQAPSTFNALVPYAAFGWLPKGFSESLVPASLGSVLASESNLVIRTAWASYGRHVRLTVNARGACKVVAAPAGTADTCGNGLGPATGRVPPVNGRPARPVADGGIAWEYAPDAWAVLIPEPGWKPVGNALKAIPAVSPAELREIASHVLFGQRQPIFFPFRLAGGLPPGWQVNDVQFRISGNRMIATDGFFAGPASSPQALDLEIGQSVVRSCYPISGQPAPVTKYGVQWLIARSFAPIDEQQNICAADPTPQARYGAIGRVDGLQVWISLSLPSPLGDAFAVYHRLTLLGPSPAGWTDRPLGGPDS